MLLFIMVAGIRFEEIYPGFARGIGMGEIYTGSGIESYCYSCGLSGYFKGCEVVYNRTSLDFGSEYDVIGGMIGKGLVMGIKIERIKTGDIPVTEAGDTIPGTHYPEVVYLGTCEYRSESYSMGIGYVVKGIGISMVVEFNEMSLYHYYGRGWSFSCGIGLKRGIIDVGLMMKNYPFSGFEWSNGFKEDIDFEVKGIAGIDLFRNSCIDGIFCGTGIDYFSGGGIKYHAGFEIGIGGVMKFRGGYDGEGIGFGVGFEGKGLSLDYGYSTREEIRGNHNISIGWRM